MNSAHPGDGTESTRRRFYVSFIYGLAAVIGGTLSVPAFVYLFFPPKAKSAAEWVDAGDLSKIPVNAPQEVVFQRKRVDGWKITAEKSTAWVVKTPSNEVVAFSPICTHLGCSIHWDDPTKKFVCPCHNSVFNMDGTVVGGPAPRPLDRFEVKVANNQLQIGPVQRNA